MTAPTDTGVERMGRALCCADGECRVKTVGPQFECNAPHLVDDARAALSALLPMTEGEEREVAIGSCEFAGTIDCDCDANNLAPALPDCLTRARRTVAALVAALKGDGHAGG